MFKNISKYLYFSFIPFLTLGLITIVLLSLGIIPLYYLFFSLIGWCLISGLGVAVGYHRVFSHQTHTALPRWKENVLLFFGALSGQGSSITWTAVHRGYHHRHSDTDRDLHTPKKGLLYAFVGWTRNITENNTNLNLKFAGSLLKKSNHVWFHKNSLYILWLTPLIVSVIDWRLSLTAFCLPTALSLLQDNTINLVGHLRSVIGYRNFNTNDNSHNNVIMGYLGWGQGWHNNHHHCPGNYDFGRGVSGQWWEWDPSTIFLILLGKPNAAG